ncbi:GNAT family N-acetyltransferase [Candidatus Microgenomates bacterium]|nr:GNAT family N-acetyltransferase [Candidatus Microgenomates bacterium]
MITPEIPMSNWPIKRIVSADYDFMAACRLLKDNFPEPLLGNVESYAQILVMEERENEYPDESYFLVIKDMSERVAGTAIFAYLKRPNVIYLEYIATERKHRRSGIASRLLWEGIKMIRHYGYSPQAIVMEVAKPSEELDGYDVESVRKRLKFFADLGSKVIEGVDYRMPTYTHQREIPAYLIVRPLSENFHFEKWQARQILWALFYHVFRYDGDISEERADKLYKITSASISNLSLVDPRKAL